MLIISIRSTNTLNINEMCKSSEMVRVINTCVFISKRNYEIIQFLQFFYKREEILTSQQSKMEKCLNGHSINIPIVTRLLTVSPIYRSQLFTLIREARPYKRLNTIINNIYNTACIYNVYSIFVSL